MFLKVLQIINFSSLLLLSVAHSKLVSYTLNISYATLYPDGVMKSVLTANGQFPGPLIEAEIGDILQVDVINNIQDHQNTAIHWHGIHQNGSQFQDGVSMITQCPLKYGNTQRYSFKVGQIGTYWYHSHFRSQYTDGLYGPIIIRNPKEVPTYDFDLIVLLSDWYHKTAKENEAFFLSPLSGGIPPFPNSSLINGHGRFPCLKTVNVKSCYTSRQLRPVFQVQAGKRYRLRVINVSAITSFQFSVDGHKLQTIEADGVSIDPESSVAVDYATITVGQRYSFILKPILAASTGQRYLIRSTVVTDVLTESQNSSTPYLLREILLPTATGVLVYAETSGSPTFEQFDYTQIVPTKTVNSPVYLDDKQLTPSDGLTAPANVNKEFILRTTFTVVNSKVHSWFNNSQFLLPKDQPLLVNVFKGKNLPKHSNPMVIDYLDVVQIVINNPEPIHHSIHLHGHVFYIVGSGLPFAGNFDPRRHPLQLKTVKRDTVLLPQGSWVVLRFVANNPGLWSLHCHFDWHNLEGMVMTFVEAAGLVRNQPIPDEARRVCKLQGITI